MVEIRNTGTDNSSETMKEGLYIFDNPDEFLEFMANLQDEYLAYYEGADSDE